MPDGREYLAVAIVIVGIIAVGFVTAMILLWNVTQRLERWCAASVSLLCSSVVIYSFLLYKTQLLRLPPPLWYLLWTLSAGGAAWLCVRVLIHKLRKRSLSPQNVSRRRFVQQSLALGVGTIVGSRIATYEPADVVIERQEYAPSWLARECDGLTIAVLSDLHAGPYLLPQHTAYFVECLRREKPDICILPGDFITASADEFHEHAKFLKTIRAPLGVYAVLGNHDYFNASAPRLRGILAECGIRVLDDHVHNVAGLDLLGISDQHRNAPELFCHGCTSNTLMQRLVSSQSPIVIVHRPFVFDAIAQINSRALVIAAHTHGGQIALTLGGETFSLNRLFSPYVHGWYKHADAAMYVTSGVGVVGVPVRVGVPPEIVVLTLRSRDESP